MYWDSPGDLLGKRMPPLPRSGNAIDGSKVVHTTTVYRSDTAPPFISKDKTNELVYRYKSLTGADHGCRCTGTGTSAGAGTYEGPVR